MEARCVYRDGGSDFQGLLTLAGLTLNRLRRNAGDCGIDLAPEVTSGDLLSWGEPGVLFTRRELPDSGEDEASADCRNLWLVAPPLSGCEGKRVDDGYLTCAPHVTVPSCEVLPTAVVNVNVNFCW